MIMTDVFISYARANKTFVQRLHDALQGHGRKAWVDWKDIPPSAGWIEEIFQAIEGSDTVILVVSPEFAAAAMCAKEVAHATEHNKRIVPILITHVHGDSLPASVRERQWISCR